MKKILLLFSAFLLINSLFAQQVDFTEFDLENGLHVILHQDNAAPVVVTSVTVSYTHLTLPTIYSV